MANDEYDQIKAGVNGALDDAPSPSGEVVSQNKTEEIPETNYAETSYAPTTDYSTQEYSAPQPGLDSERIHEVIEAIVEEKWEEFAGKAGNIVVWKEKVNNDVIAIKQELLRLEENFKALQNAVLGKVRDYDEGIRGVHTEMRALEKVFEKILEPLSSNIKDLNRVTEELKKIKK